MEERRAMIIYSDGDIRVVNHNHLTQSELRKPLYVFDVKLKTDGIIDKDLGIVSIPAISSIVVFCLENEVDTMKEDMFIEYNSIKERLKQIINENI